MARALYRSLPNIVFVTLLVLACTGVETQPRPKNVPPSAVWAGGSDGGAWINCRFAYKEPYVGYACTMFTDHGSTWAEGQYVLANIRHDGGRSLYEPAGALARVDSADYQFFDGVKINLRNNRALLPHLVVNFPFGDGHGKRAKYRFGKQVSPEEQY